MTVRGIKALNTSAGLSNYVVAAVGMPHEVCIITKAFDECGLHQHEMAFIHKEASKEGGPILIKCIDIVVLGFCGELCLERRKNLFNSKEEVSLLDDTGKTISRDYNRNFYSDVINWGTQPGQYVLFQHACSGEGPLAAVFAGRNVMVLTVNADLLHLVKRSLAEEAN